MKKATFYLTLLFCAIFMVTGLASCLDSDDDSTGSIDNATQQKYMNSISLANSPSTVRFYYITSNGNYTLSVKYDSITNGSVYSTFRTDSTFNVRHFPVCKLDSAVRVDSTVTTGTIRQIFDAIHNSTIEASFSGYYWIPSTSYVQSSYVQYAMNAIFTTTLNYGGSPHNVAFYFSQNASYGVYQLSSGVNQYMLYLSGIYLDYKSISDPGTLLSSSNFRPLAIYFTKN